MGDGLQVLGDFGPAPRELRVAIDGLALAGDHVQVTRTASGATVLLSAAARIDLVASPNPSPRISVTFLKQVLPAMGTGQPECHQVQHLSDDRREACVLSAQLGQRVDEFQVWANGRPLPPSQWALFGTSCLRVTLPEDSPAPLDLASLEVWRREAGTVTVVRDELRLSDDRLQALAGTVVEAALDASPQDLEELRALVAADLAAQWGAQDRPDWNPRGLLLPPDTQGTALKKITRLPSEARRILDALFRKQRYLTPADVERLAGQTQVNRKTITNYFTNKRKRSGRPLADPPQARPADPDPSSSSES